MDGPLVPVLFEGLRIVGGFVVGISPPCPIYPGRIWEAIASRETNFRPNSAFAYKFTKDVCGALILIS